MGDDEGSFGEAASDQLANEGLPEAGLESSGAQEAPVLFAQECMTFYDTPATDPDSRRVTVNVVLDGSDDEGYTYCAVTIRPPRVRTSTTTPRSTSSWAAKTRVASTYFGRPARCSPLARRGRVRTATGLSDPGPCRGFPPLFI
jgi:hypothetical protein